MLAMWVPELPFQLACGRDATLRQRPLAFLNPESPRTPSLWFVNRLAREAGLCPGESLEQALRRAPGLQVLDPAPQVWWEAQGSFADFLQHWTPQGQLGRLGEAMVELQGLERVSGAPRDTALRMARELAGRYGWTSHGGLSASATAARIASRLEQRLECVADGFEAAFLAPQPLRRLPDLAPRLRTRFHRLGLRCFEDLQPMPLPVLCELVPERLAPGLLAQARGEDRPKLPLLADPPGSSRTPWRLQPPRLPEEVALASWCLGRLWAEPRSPRSLTLRWWDADGEPHFWKAGAEDLARTPMELVGVIERGFRALCTRRILVRELELRVHWGLGRARPLFQEPRAQKFERLEPALARLRQRYPANPVQPGWLAAEVAQPRAG